MQRVELSIIIVNYNVKHFLEQCLRSVRKAIAEISAEVIVVDNNSVDGSQQMLREKFGAAITLIENRDNPGFSKANNQGIAMAKGRYILLLNPDTIVEETTFTKCLAFMDEHPDAGALGVKMIDGKGRFLAESKRALPTAWVSFYKIFGLARLFPRSKRFGKYHLTYLDKDKTHAVEILSGAFMWLRKDLLDRIGNLDERFFMYGEDIDLSYRVILAGYKCYYFADTQIIHYKGESTKKGSLNYVRVFYNAMIIFARKHFGGNRKRLFITAIRMAVYLRAGIAILTRMVRQLGFPLLEAVQVFVTMFGIKAYWEHYVKYIEGGAYPPEFTWAYMPAYTLVLIGFLWLAGAYKKPYKLKPLVMAPFWAFIAIATTTYMFSGIHNFSRAIVGLSAVFTVLIAIVNRGLLNMKEKGTFFFTEPAKKRVLLAGDAPGIRRITALIRGELDYPVEIVGSVSPGEWSADHTGTDYLGPMIQLREIIRFYDIEEVIFCNESIPTEKILEAMLEGREKPIAYKIVPPGADYIVGPQVIHTSRFSRQIRFNLQHPAAQVHKQVFDFISSTCLMATFPLIFWLYQKPVEAFKKIIQVFSRKYHMVGYIHAAPSALPQLKPGVLNMLDRAKGEQPSAMMNTQLLDTYYARTYSWDLDLEILLKGWRRIA